ncbi:MAG: glyoxalase [Bacteroidota bacterium]
MKHVAKSIRAFIGAKNYESSRDFYNDLGFVETVLSKDMSVFHVSDSLSFYLQDAYVKDWIDNSMIFLEVDDLDRHLAEIHDLKLPEKYPGVRVSKIVDDVWGREFFVHDPSGVLWHFGEFK